MTTELIPVAFAILAAVVLLLFLIRRYPLRVLRQHLRCPEHNLPARVDFLRGEAGFGNFVVLDVLSCSLEPGGPPACERRCTKCEDL